MCAKGVNLLEKCNIMNGELRLSEVKIEVKDIAIQILNSSDIFHGRAMDVLSYMWFPYFHGPGHRLRRLSLLLGTIIKSAPEACPQQNPSTLLTSCFNQ